MRVLAPPPAPPSKPMPILIVSALARLVALARTSRLPPEMLRPPLTNALVLPSMVAVGSIAEIAIPPPAPPLALAHAVLVDEASTCTGPLVLIVVLAPDDAPDAWPTYASTSRSTSAVDRAPIPVNPPIPAAIVSASAVLVP